MMADCVGFQAQIASIIEILANSAVAEICKLVDDGYAALRSQMEQEREKSEKENDVLRQRLRDMDVKIRSYERKMRRRSQREEITAVQFRPPEGKAMQVVSGGLLTLIMKLIHDTSPCIHHFVYHFLMATSLVFKKNSQLCNNHHWSICIWPLIRELKDLF